MLKCRGDETDGSLRNERRKVFKTIVWVTDGSSHADSALPVIAELAGVHGSRVVALHLVESPHGTSGSGTGTPATEYRVRQELDSQVEALRAAGVDTELEVARMLGAHSAASVADESARLGADLIVVGTPAYGDSDAILSSGLAAGLAYHATSPVLVVPGKAAVAASRADLAYASPWSWR
jgi:nucleotide-binding universal stress UspA family protein